MTDKNDITPEEWRLPLLEAALTHIPFDGWTDKAMRAAAADLELPPAMAELAFPGGVAEMMEAYFSWSDARLAARLLEMDLMNMKIRARITEAVKAKLDLNEAHREVARRTVPSALLPHLAPVAAKALWNTCDVMWRAAGDTATDHNHYTKRATLAAVYGSVLLCWLGDESEGYTETLAFLDRRIENVMLIEKTKFEMRKMTENLPSFSRFLSKLRYPDTVR